MRLNLLNTGVRYNATDVRLDSGKASEITLSPGNLSYVIGTDIWTAKYRGRKYRTCVHGGSCENYASGL